MAQDELLKVKRRVELLQLKQKVDQWHGETELQFLCRLFDWYEEGFFQDLEEDDASTAAAESSTREKDSDITDPPILCNSSEDGSVCDPDKSEADHLNEACRRALTKKDQIADLLNKRTNAMNVANENFDVAWQRGLHSFKGHPEQDAMREVFDNEDRLQVNPRDGKVSMKCYYMHPGRKNKGVVRKYCGCYFSGGLWQEGTIAKKTHWYCKLDWARVQMAFPHEHAVALKANPDLHTADTGCCGLKYYPWKDGAACLIELQVDDDTWIPLVSELIPEHIMDRFKEAQAEWYGVLQTDKAADIKIRIVQHSTKPSVTALVPHDTPLGIVGKYPLETFYDEGQKPITAVEWVSYFMQVSDQGDHKNEPALKLLSKACRKFLNRHNMEVKNKNPELLPSDLARGSLHAVTGEPTEEKVQD